MREGECFSGEDEKQAKGRTRSCAGDHGWGECRDEGRLRSNGANVGQIFRRVSCVTSVSRVRGSVNRQTGTELARDEAVAVRTRIGGTRSHTNRSTTSPRRRSLVMIVDRLTPVTAIVAVAKPSR